MIQPPTPDELKSLFAYVISVLEQLHIPYMVVGGFAAITYGEVRFTADVDIVVNLQPAQVDSFVAAFPIPAYYISREGILDSLARRYPFNIIKPDTGAKIDLIPMPADPATRAAFARRRSIIYDEPKTACFAAPEDIVIAKLHTYQETGAEKHLRDARGILVIQWGRLNLDIISAWAQIAGMEETWQALLEIARQEAAENQSHAIGGAGNEKWS